MEECPICHSEIKDKVYMTCSSRHAFCFECILKGVEASNELKNCPMCRGGGFDRYILVDNNENICDNTNNFYSISNFKRSLPIVQKILELDPGQNSCLISEKLLLFYVKNKSQIEYTNILNNKYSIDEIIPVIKWNMKNESGENVIVNDLLGTLASGLFTGQHPYVLGGSGAPYQQFMRF